jgi:hypothetical protein
LTGQPERGVGAIVGESTKERQRGRPLSSERECESDDSAERAREIREMGCVRKKKESTGGFVRSGGREREQSINGALIER